MTDRVTIKWDPDPPLSKQLARLKRPRSLFRSYEGIMMALKNAYHNKEGLAPNKWKKSEAARKRDGKTGWDDHNLMPSWKRGSTSKTAKIFTPVSYAVDFYKGHPARQKVVPAHQRRLKSGKYTGVRAHTRREPAQPARDIVWTNKYMKKAIAVTGKFILK